MSSVESLVADLDSRILAEVPVTADLIRAWLDQQRELGLLHGDRPLCPYLRPHYLARSRYDEISRAARTIHQAFERLVDAALIDHQLLDELDLTEGETHLARIDPGYRGLCVTSRLDTFVTSNGFQFLEYNAESPAGLGDQVQLERFLFALKHNRDFLAQHKHWLPRPADRLLIALVEAYRDWGGTEAKPQIAIVDWDGVSTASEFDILRDVFEAAGHPTIIADPHELEYDGRNLWAGGFRIDIFYKRVIIHEFLERFDDSQPLLRAYRDHNICMANSFQVKIAHKKRGFAILSDPQYRAIFTADQLECIDRHIPWTRVLRAGRTPYRDSEVDLLEFTLRNRERLTLKPNDDYGGAGIYLGWELNDSEWEAAITDAVTKSYVVQEKAPTEKIRIPGFLPQLALADVFADFDPFLFLGQVEGGLVRLSGSSLINVSQGGGETACVILEDH